MITTTRWPLMAVWALSFTFAVPAMAFAQNTAEKIVVGDTKVTAIASYKGQDKLPAPSSVILRDFDVPSGIITIDHSPAAHVLSNGPIAHVKGDVGKEQDPSAIAKQVQAAFSKALLSDLKKTSISVIQSPLGTNPDAPIGSLVIRGNFTIIKQGNKAARMMIGLGRGASDVQAHVLITLLTADGPLLLSEFKVEAASGKKPGAVETMGVGSLAVGAAADAATDSKSSVEGDASRIANAVARELKNIMTAQQWVPPHTDGTAMGSSPYRLR